MEDKKKIKKGVCHNYGNCDKANTQEIIEIEEGQPFECPECHEPLTPIGGTPPPPTWIERLLKSKMTWVIVLLIAAVIVILITIWKTPTSNNTPATNGPKNNPEKIDTLVQDTIPPDTITPPTPRPKPIFGGAATLSADGKVITFNRGYNLDLKGFEDETLYLHPGDKIKYFEIKNGCLIRGELYTAGGEERLLTGLNERL